MNKEWNNVEFKFGTSSDSQIDFAVADFGSRMGVVDRLSSRKLAKEAFTEKLKELKKDQNEPQKIFIPYEGRGGMTALILQGEVSTFTLQTQLRKAFSGQMKLSEKDLSINLSILGVKDSVAKQILSAMGSLAVLIRFSPEVFGKKASEVKKQGKFTFHIQTSLQKKIAEEILNEGRTLGFCNNQVRYLADLPSNVLNPSSYYERIQSIAKEIKVDCEFLDVKDLKKMGAGAFLAVVKGDLNHRAGIAHLKYKGKKAKKKIAIVGKGLCFDTGGYDVKTNSGMLGMHRDMTGSAVALSLFRAFVELNSEYEIDCYLALAENLISHESYRPNDVVVASNGMSIEVVDTDAEGRMVLADTLAFASEKKPDLIIDFATLTGSVVRSLDTRRCGAYSNFLKVSNLAVSVGEQCGERVWNFPIGDDYNDSLKSDIADIRQCASSACSDHIYASTFLSKFVGEKISWLHIDLAADTNKGGLGIVPTESTGFGVRFGYYFVSEFLGN